MKMSLRVGVVVLLLPWWTVGASPLTNRNDDAAFIAAVMPGVREIQPTVYGYRVATTGGVVSVYRTYSGFRAPNVEAVRTPYGYSVRDAKVRTYHASWAGYSTEGGDQIRRTRTGYDLGSGTLTSNINGYTYRRK